MALGTIGSAIAGSLASSAVNFGVGKLFGGKKGEAQAPLANFVPTGINAGGLNTGFSGGNITVTPTGDRAGLVSNIASQFGTQADLTAGLRESVAPGYSALRASRLNEIENARSRSIGNLRENLARRRVLGSSFGQDAIVRAEKEFAGERERVAAESFLAELEATNQLINQEFSARRSQFQTGLDDLNLQADVAIKLSGKASDALSGNARMMALLNAQEAAGAGKFFGQTFQPVAKAVGEGVGSWFSGGDGGKSLLAMMPTDL